jgi:hypothetical protein
MSASLSSLVRKAANQFAPSNAAPGGGTAWEPYPETPDVLSRLASILPKPSRSPAPTPPAGNVTPLPRPAAPASPRPPAANPEAAKAPPKVDELPRAAVRRERLANVLSQAPKPAPRAAVIDPSKLPVSTPQYLRELDSFSRTHARDEISKAVLNVAPSEVEASILMAARLRGRYLARVLDATQPSKRGFGEAEAKELAKLREMAEEAQRGVEALRKAIESGDLAIPGLNKA